MTTFHLWEEGWDKVTLCKSKVLTENDNFSFWGGRVKQHFANLKSNLKVATFHFQGEVGGMGKVALLLCWGNLANFIFTFDTQSA